MGASNDEAQPTERTPLIHGESSSSSARMSSLSRHPSVQNEEGPAHRMTLPPLPTAAVAHEFSKQQREMDPVNLDEEAEDIARLARMVHTGDVRGVRRMMSELGEYGRLDDGSSFALSAPTPQLHVTARWAHIDHQTSLSIQQLAMRELDRHPRSAAAAEIVALLTAEARVHHTAARPKLMRALRRLGLQVDSAMLVGDFIDGGKRSAGGRHEEEGSSTSIDVGNEETKRGQKN